MPLFALIWMQWLYIDLHADNINIIIFGAFLTETHPKATLRNLQAVSMFGGASFQTRFLCAQKE